MNSFYYLVLGSISIPTTYSSPFLHSVVLTHFCKQYFHACPFLPPTFFLPPFSFSFHFLSFLLLFFYPTIFVLVGSLSVASCLPTTYLLSYLPFISFPTYKLPLALPTKTFLFPFAFSSTKENFSILPCVLYHYFPNFPTYYTCFLPLDRFLNGP